MDASAWGDHDKNPVDLTEAYLQFRPYPVAGYRFRIKAGAFYAPMSLENRTAGWESPYTVAYSAINTWFAARSCARLALRDKWIGWARGPDTGSIWRSRVALFGWNDPAGVVIATRGFALGDRQTTLFGRLGAPTHAALQSAELFHEIDGHAGYYAGVEARYFDRVVVRALHYDNRADPAEVDARSTRFRLETRFNSAGVRVEGASGWTAIFQWLDGKTVSRTVSRET